jgi:hypothetical protein
MHTMHQYTTDDDTTRWSVGFWQPEAYGEPAKWCDLLDFINMIDAARWVSYLNGGERPVTP